VALVGTDISEERAASISWVIRISGLGIALAVTSNFLSVLTCGLLRASSHVSVSRFGHERDHMQSGKLATEPN
jgi:hypothetical protein